MSRELLARYGGPAFMRRAKRVEQAVRSFLDACRQQRDDWLMMVRIHLGTLKGLAGDWRRLEPLLADADQVAILQQLEADLRPALRVPIEPVESPRRLKRAVRDLARSIDRFNRRWTAHLAQLDYEPVNRHIEGYNRHYVFEKECVVGSPRVARQGFQAKETLTAARLQEMFPPLPRLRLAGDVRGRTDTLSHDQS